MCDEDWQRQELLRSQELPVGQYLTYVDVGLREANKREIPVSVREVPTPCANKTKVCGVCVQPHTHTLWRPTDGRARCTHTLHTRRRAHGLGLCAHKPWRGWRGWWAAGVASAATGGCVRIFNRRAPRAGAARCTRATAAVRARRRWGRRRWTPVVVVIIVPPRRRWRRPASTRQTHPAAVGGTGVPATARSGAGATSGCVARPCGGKGVGEIELLQLQIHGADGST